jgi:2-oxoglutarate/2-oxoacid ferredoxin oxidoreductase subunit alpha
VSLKKGEQMQSNPIMNGVGLKGSPEDPVNDFSITFSTVNGSGSATANTTILRALFKMGIPVSGKNIFPSNIQGLPTWYTIRISKKGYTARIECDDIVVAMNQSSIEDDIRYLNPKGVLFYSDDIALPPIPETVVTYPMPIKSMAKETEAPAGLRDYISNMIYVGILAKMLDIQMAKIRLAVEYHFQGKEKAIQSNMEIIQNAFLWAEKNLEKKDPYRVEPMDMTNKLIMSDGNTAAALGAIFGGVQFSAWYPITPASTLAESLNEYLPQYRKEPETGKATYVVVQAEDELAAIGMTIGAGWAGLRSMTSTSGPGLSLMAEYMGLAYYAEVPVVVWDVQRVGPSTGLPTRTAQGDLTFSYFLGHGDTQYLILIPGSVDECFEFGWKAFDIAERYQTPVIVLSDLDLGMNQWMAGQFVYPDKPIDRGKVLWEEDLKEHITKHDGKWGRYLDIDGDGIPYRTIPGNQHPLSAYFARGTGHDEFGQYSEDAKVWEEGLNRISRKLENAREYLPKPEMNNPYASKIGILSSGSAHPAVEEAIDILKSDGISTDYMRIRAIPFSNEVRKFLHDHDRVYVVELNRDGQLHQILSLEIPAEAQKLIKTTHVDGLPLTAKWICGKIRSNEETIK